MNSWFARPLALALVFLAHAVPAIAQAPLLAPAPGSPPAPGPLRFTLRPEVLSLPQCLAQPGAVPLTLPADAANLEIVDWAAGPSERPEPGQFTLRFASPLPVGSVIVEGASAVEMEISGRWQELEPGPEAGRSLQFLPLPAGAPIDALRFTVPAVPLGGVAGAPGRYQAVLRFLTLVPIRLDNVAREARVTRSGIPSGRDPAGLVNGVVESLPAPAAPGAGSAGGPPEWVLLQWPEPQLFRGLAVFRGDGRVPPGPVQLEAYTGAGDAATAVATQDWRRLVGRATAPGRYRGNEFFVSGDPPRARALRLTGITGPGPALAEIAVLRDLGLEPAPVVAAKEVGGAREWMVPRAAGPWQVDGRADDWPGSVPRTNGMALAWDDEGLRLLYQATGEAARFENRGTNLQELFFTGDAVELLLQTQPGQDPARTQPGRGDVRVVFSVWEGRPVAVLYEFRSEDLLVVPVAFRTGARVVECDKVTELKSARVALQRAAAGGAGPGCTLEALVPWSALGMQPAALREVRGDFGRIEASPARRLRWAESVPLAPGDLAAAAAVHPARWGVLRFAAP